MKKTFIQNQESLIHGYVSEGFEQVKEEFIKNFTQRDEIGAACSIYYKGEKVVDLWGGYKNKKTCDKWKENTVVEVFSTTKGMALLVLAKLHSDGLLDYDAQISKYWPEFAKNGKENITVKDLITHRAGLVLLKRKVKLSELNNHEIMSRLLEDTAPMWEPGTKMGYHAATVGLYEQQIVRRIDKKGRTIGTYFKEEIADPLEADFYIGLSPGFDIDRIAVLKKISLISGIFNLGKPPKGMSKKLVYPFSLLNKSFTVIKSDIKDSVKALEYENPAGGGLGDARSLAKIYGIIASNPEKIGISQKTLKIMMDYIDTSEEGTYDVVMGFRSRGSKGGYAKPAKIFDFGSKKAFGFVGSGGSFSFADPEYEIGYAYIMNKMDFYGMNDPREIALREAMYNCIKKIKATE